MAASVTDHLANERTYLAWVRTGIAIMAFGFVVARFGLYLRELAARAASGAAVTPLAPKPMTEWTGILLLLAGSAVVSLAFIRYRRIRSDLQEGRYRVHDGLAWGLSTIMVLVGVGLALYLILSA